MRLAIKMLDAATDPNCMREVRSASIRRGETATVSVQLYNEVTGLRYVPGTTAAVTLEIPRSPVYTGTLMNVRQTTDPSISRTATKPYAGDWSVWQIPLSAAETLTLVSGGIRATMVEGPVTLKAALDMALEVHPEDGVS
jgi:hypothetical protein